MPRVNEVRVMADRMTPATQRKRWLRQPTMSLIRLVSKVREASFAVEGEAMPRHDLNSRSGTLAGHERCDFEDLSCGAYRQLRHDREF
jgi:hypothetical protein